MQAQDAVGANDDPSFEQICELLGFPEGFGSREVPRQSDSVDVVLAEIDEGLSRRPPRRFVSGLLLAFALVVEELFGQTQDDRLDDLLEQYPAELKNPRGQPRESLVIAGPSRKVSLRAHYNHVEHLVHFDLRRFDYPAAPLHAARAWPQYRDALTTIGSMTPGERALLVRGLVDVLESLRKFEERSPEEIAPRPFVTLLREFVTRIAPEPTGAALQGMAFAYYRADAPTVTLETSSVRAGGSRRGAVGDVDGWGEGLVLSIEVKDMDLTDIGVLAGFLRNLGPYPNATAIVVARSFTDALRDDLRERNVLSLTKEAMADAVELWDLGKQHLAMREFGYFLRRIQRNTSLIDRFEAFVEDHELLASTTAAVEPTEE